MVSVVSTQHGDCTNYMLQAAAREVIRHLSPHEGLYEACIRYIRWIDPECEIQAEMAIEFAIWRNSLIPTTERDDFVDRLCLALRSLTVAQAREKAAKLVRMANSSLTQGNSAIPNIPDAWYNTPEGLHWTLQASADSSRH